MTKMIRQSRLIKTIGDSVRFALDGCIRFSGPPGTVGLRWPLLARASLGGMLGRLFHQFRIPFYLTPLFALPWAGLGAWLLYTGNLWAGVLCSFMVACVDIADGVAQGYVVDPLPRHRRPERHIRFRKRLDSFIVDPTCRFLLYGVFALRLHEEQLVPAFLLIAMLVIELSNNLMAASATNIDRSGELFYEFKLDPKHRAQYQPFFRLKVLLGHLSAYHGYSLFPLVGYLWPLSQIGQIAFGLVFTVRFANFLVRVAALPARALQSESLGCHRRVEPE